MISMLHILVWLTAGFATARTVTEQPCACKGQEAFPVPPASKATLFYIQRTPNTNTILYDVKLKKGVPDEEDPVHAYWIRYQEEGQQEDLSFIQRNYAYGLKTKKLSADKYELRFVSYKKLPFYLVKTADSQFHVLATINGRNILVSRVFLQIEGGTFWLPNIVCAEVKGTDPVTGQEIIQNFKP